MSKKNVEKSKKMINENKRLIPLLGVSFIIFLVVLSFYLIFNYISTGLGNDKLVTGWEYQYSKNGEFELNADMRTYTQQSPILTEKDVVKDYLYLSKRIEASDNDRYLTIITDHSPIKIILNGVEIYNNHYEDGRYTGNCYNAIELTGNGHEHNVEVYMKIPLSVQFEARLKEISENEIVASFNPSGSFFVCVGFAIVGIILAIVSVVLCIKYKKILWTLNIALFVAYTSIAEAVYYFSYATYLFNASIWFNISIGLMFCSFFIGICTHMRFFAKKLKQMFLSVFIGLIFVAAVSFSPTILILKIVVGVMCIVAISLEIYLLNKMTESLKRRTQYAQAMSTNIILTIINIIFIYIMFIARIRGVFEYSIMSSMVLSSLISEYIAYSRHSYARKNQQLQLQSSIYGDSVDSLSILIKNILKCKSEIELIKNAGNEVSKLIKMFNNVENDINYCVAVKNGEVYNEVVNRNVVNCNYELIEKNYLLHSKKCIFSETYFEYILLKGNEVYAIMHFDGVKNGISPFFASMIESAYCSIEIAFEKMILRFDNSELRNIIFEQLAETAELSDGGSLDHLNSISKITYILCKQLGFDEDKCVLIRDASKLHDLGKIAIPKSIIDKEGKLSKEENIIMRNHTKFGYVILSAYENDKFLAVAAEIAKYHHESFDGNGYNMLKGTDIPLSARIVTVCDVFDALTSKRSYKEAWRFDDAVNYINENSGIMFDPEIVSAFNQCLPDIKQIKENK